MTRIDTIGQEEKEMKIQQLHYHGTRDGVMIASGVLSETGPWVFTQGPDETSYSPYMHCATLDAAREKGKDMYRPNRKGSSLGRKAR